MQATKNVEAPSPTKSVAQKAGSGVRKLLDMTVGNVGFGIGFGAAYAAAIPVLGVPFASLNEGVSRGYGNASVRIIASRIADGKTTVSEEMGKLDEDTRTRLANHIEHRKGSIAKNEDIDPETGEIFKGGRSLSEELLSEQPGGPMGAVGGAPA